MKTRLQVGILHEKTFIFMCVGGKVEVEKWALVKFDWLVWRMKKQVHVHEHVGIVQFKNKSITCLASPPTSFLEAAPPFFLMKKHENHDKHTAKMIFLWIKNKQNINTDGHLEK